MSRSRRTAGALLLLSGVTHAAQPALYGLTGPVLAAVAFGLAYLAIGAGLLRPGHRALWWGALLPAVGGVLGLIRFAAVDPNPFTLFHVAIDAVVVPLCVFELRRTRRERIA